MLGDGNCLFRAVTLCLTGSQGGHGALRASVASYLERSNAILNGLIDTSPDDSKTLAGHIRAVRSDGVAVGEDAILAIAEVIHRDVCVHVAYTEPLVYRPINGHVVSEPVNVAFFEPGHYKAVFTEKQLDDQNMNQNLNA